MKKKYTLEEVTRNLVRFADAYFPTQTLPTSRIWMMLNEEVDRLEKVLRHSAVKEVSTQIGIVYLDLVLFFRRSFTNEDIIVWFPKKVRNDKKDLLKEDDPRILINLLDKKWLKKIKKDVSKREEMHKEYMILTWKDMNFAAQVLDKIAWYYDLTLEECYGTAFTSILTKTAVLLTDNVDRIFFGTRLRYLN